MIGLGKLTKLASGNMGPDQFLVLCEALGLQVEFQEVPREAFREAIGKATTPLLSPSARLLYIKGEGRDGSQMEALIVLRSAGAGKVETILAQSPKRGLTLAAS